MTTQEFVNNYSVLTDDDVLKVIDYFEDNYIGRRRRRNRAPPLFSHEVWNINSRVINHLPRTNNSVEGWNRKMQSAVGASHPNLWRFLNVLKREQGLLNTIIDQSLGGHAPEPSRKKYRDCNARIQNIVDDYGNRDSIEFLRGIAHNLHL